MPTETKLSPKRAVVFGLVCIAASLVPILAGLGKIPIKPTDGTPGWVGVCCGLAFLFAGFILFSDAVDGVLGPDGQVLDSAPAWVKSFQAVMGFAIVTSLASVTSWVAFGSGDRHFQSSISLPFVAYRTSSSDSVGRWVFGFMAVIMWCMIGGALIRGARNALAKNGAGREG
jgi:hypothetical protein